MMKQIFPTILFACLATAMFAQMPENITLPANAKFGTPGVEKMACADQFAGTIQLGNFQGVSNDFNNNGVTYLCIDDQFDVTHNGDQDLTGDPQTATAPGVTYAFYDCPPTEAGPNLATILTDACLTLDPPPTENIYVTGSQGDINGNITFQNLDFDGNGVSDIVEFFMPPSNGLQLWFSPITIDEFSNIPGGSGYEDDANTGETGPCVNSNINEQFSVVYLNPINAQNQSTDGCTGSFEINGGLPQFDGNSSYTIDIALTSDPNITAIINTGSAEAGETVGFTAPQPGTYDVTITDDKACPASFQIVIGACSNITFNAGIQTVPPNSNVCVPITVDGWQNLVSGQLTIDYDETVLGAPITFQNFNPNVPGLNMGNLNDTGASGITFSWNTFGGPVTIPDGSTIFEICFTVIGPGGSSSPISFNDNAIVIEFIADNGNGDEPIGFTGNDGTVNVTIEPIFVGLDSTNISCPGASDGTFTVTASGGVAPYSVSWQGSAGGVQGPGIINIDGGTFTANALSADTYTITVTDNAGDMVTTSVMIEEGESFGANLEFTSPTCFGDCDGTVTANVLINGVIANPTGYTFMWDTGDMTQTLIDQCQGAYAVTITSPDGCTAVASATMGQPGPLDPNPNITDATCSGAGDGGIQLNITGGIFPYMTNWLAPNNLPPNSFNINGLDEGVYIVEITDNNNCIDTFSMEVLAIKELSLAETITPVSCNGANDGSLVIIASTTGGISTTYNFNCIGAPTPPPPVVNGNTSMHSNLQGGTITCFVADNEGCQVEGTYIIPEPDVLDIVALDLQNETCNIGNDGSVTLGVSGGTYPYTYDWGPMIADTDSIVTGLSAGMYPVMVSDANGCSEQFDVIINAPQPPQIIDLQDDMVSCPNSTDGTLTVVAMDGSAPINSYNWSNGGTMTTIDDLSPGEYVVTITATDGCVTIDTALVIAPDPITLDTIITMETNCPGEGGGTLTILVNGGTSPFFYEWSNGTTGENVNTIGGGAITAGTYGVTITDANNCESVEFSGEVMDPPAIVATFSAIDSVSCAAGNGVPCDGSATATAEYSDGVQGNFIFTWSSGESISGVNSSTADMLCEGWQYVTIQDAGCSSIDSVFIEAPEPVTQNSLTSGPMNVSCFGSADGSITVNGQGGTSPYTYAWSTGATGTNMITDLPVGNYQVTIFDSRGCNFTYSAEVDAPPPLVAFINEASTQDTVSCNGDADGILTIAHNGGNEGPVTYMWSDNISSPDSDVADGLAPGAYSVTVTDVMGCQDSLTFIINEPPPVFFEFSFTEIECFDETSIITIDTAYGGVGGPYRFRVDNRPPISITSPLGNIPAGMHTITAIDDNGCGTPIDFEITQPNPIVIDMIDFIEVELGDSTVALDPFVSHDFPLDSIYWTPMEGLRFEGGNPLNAFVSDFINDQSYTLTVIDVNGCDESATVDVEIDRNRNVYIPNIFSPNDDGINDNFEVFACTGVSSINTVNIFNRWGDLIYTANNLDPSCVVGTQGIWDGSFNGKPVTMGVYVYIIEVEFLDGIKLLYRGDVTVMR